MPASRHWLACQCHHHAAIGVPFWLFQCISTAMWILVSVWCGRLSWLWCGQSLSCGVYRIYCCDIRYHTMLCFYAIHLGSSILSLYHYSQSYGYYGKIFVTFFSLMTILLSLFNRGIWLSSWLHSTGAIFSLCYKPFLHSLVYKFYACFHLFIGLS